MANLSLDLAQTDSAILYNDEDKDSKTHLNLDLAPTDSALLQCRTHECSRTSLGLKFPPPLRLLPGKRYVPHNRLRKSAPPL